MESVCILLCNQFTSTSLVAQKLKLDFFAFIQSVFLLSTHPITKQTSSDAILLRNANNFLSTLLLVNIFTLGRGSRCLCCCTKLSLWKFNHTQKTVNVFCRWEERRLFLTRLRWFIQNPKYALELKNRLLFCWRASFELLFRLLFSLFGVQLV